MALHPQSVMTSATGSLLNLPRRKVNLRYSFAVLHVDEDDPAPIVSYNGKEKRIIFLNSDGEEIGPESVPIDSSNDSSKSDDDLNASLSPKKAKCSGNDLSATASTCSLTLSEDDLSIDSVKTPADLTNDPEEIDNPSTPIPTVTQDDDDVSVASDLTDGLHTHQDQPVPEEIPADVQNLFNCDQDDSDIDAIDSIVGHKWSEGFYYSSFCITAEIKSTNRSPLQRKNIPTRLPNIF